MLTPQQKKIVADNISKMETVSEVFQYLENTFDLKKTKINGVIVGGEFKKGIIKAIDFLNPPLK
jgi:hypothetical protein